MSFFDKATALLDIPAQRINISATDTIKGQNFTVPVIFYKAAAGNEKRPTLVVSSGYDGSQEDLYFAVGTRALERGWNFLSYEGPGQPTVRRYQDLGFIPNWWDVVTPVVDYLETRDDVDTKKLALEGVSFGGILAPRAATREKRFVAVLAIDGLYNIETSLLAQFPTALVDIFKAGNKTEFDTFMAAAASNSSYPSSFRWVVDQGRWSFNTNSTFDWLTQLGQVNLTKDLLDEVQVPVFVGEGQDDTNFYGQGKVVADWLGDRAYYHLFMNDIGAGEHSQVGAEAELAHVSFDWLGGIFDGLAKTDNGTINL
ncbi:hypothetical protein N0V83_009653 [Neocucurbitaria cava]|uniref:Peptidase S9 prolyl oligopeptidase catalytic domain-containing protein n=1 Tax=Neocucurbitaria cava TaxID=798079 RepID=A0A9W8Y080_9PLEO|nr:hypothetical protein N0V83_009653 [Neocucurbitaria cava]